MARKEELKSEKKEKKIKKERTTKKEKMEKKSKKHKHAEFNPFLQVLACRLSNTTREFTISNDIDDYDEIMLNICISDCSW